MQWFMFVGQKPPCFNLTFKIAAGVMCLSFFFFSCYDHPEKDKSVESNVLLETKIGDQVWMVRNFEGLIFNNGDTIPHVTSTEEWVKAGKSRLPAWCYYNNDTLEGKKYGRIYNWYAINDPRGLAPKGWHVPTNDEWVKMEEFLGVLDAGARLKCSSDKNRNDSTGFCALLGGYRSKEGTFSGALEFTYFASSTQRDSSDNDVWGRGFHLANSSIMRCGLYKEHGVYVRLIKD